MPVTSPLAAKVKALRAMAERPDTPADERAAAERMLTRALRRAAETGELIEEQPAGGHAAGRTYGPKHDETEGLSIVDLARLMRQDIKLARKLGQAAAEPGAVVVPGLGALPRAVKVSVRTSTYAAGGRSIHIRLYLPADGWGLVDGQRHGRTAKVPGPVLEAALAELRDVHGAYQADYGSDLSRDLIMRRYLGGVDWTRPGEPD
ncbi:hypothetical protein [Kitasatospora aureofaciens]|uniref:hypothetical protein n=1 Tax=Kitasatospora aureofaciens TaxID=1894 RepID=UPI0034020732